MKLSVVRKKTCWQDLRQQGTHWGNWKPKTRICKGKQTALKKICWQSELLKSRKWRSEVTGTCWKSNIKSSSSRLSNLLTFLYMLNVLRWFVSRTCHLPWRRWRSWQPGSASSSSSLSRLPRSWSNYARCTHILYYLYMYIQTIIYFPAHTAPLRHYCSVSEELSSQATGDAQPAATAASHKERGRL